jgi:pilus assembly protein CpaF
VSAVSSTSTAPAPTAPQNGIATSVTPVATPGISHINTVSSEPRKRKRASINFTMPDLGILESLMADDAIQDILVNGTQGIYIDRGGQLVDSGLRFSRQEEVWMLAERIMDAVNQHWPDERPMVDTRLPDGSRVNIVAPPIAVDGVTISIRKFPKQEITLETMARNNQISDELAIFLKECVRLKANIIVAGSTGSGKTTLLNALSAGIPTTERIVTIEDSAELRLQQPHVVRLESRPARDEDAGVSAIAEVSMRDLVRNALRMRPNRIIIGESRGEEAFDVLQAMNTGHSGSMTSLHANSPRDATSRLENMVQTALPQATSRIVRQQIASAVHLIVQMARDVDGVRYVSHISEISGMETDVIIMQDLVVRVLNKDGKLEDQWKIGSPRLPFVADAARTAGMIKSLR